MNKNKITIMNFSGIYGREQFEGWETSLVEVSDIPGTNCYCDSEAFRVISERIAAVPSGGIHFIDSGNYHYMSRIWLDRVTEPVTLVVFDNHTDMQPPAFGGLLSCGGWIAAALEELDFVREVILIGPDEAAFSQVEPALREKVKFLSREKLSGSSETEIAVFLTDAMEKGQESLYFSVDKDILCPGEADTTWSQGDMTLEELVSLLRICLETASRTGKKVQGIDICGESESAEGVNNEENIRANRALLACFHDVGFM